MRTQPRPRTLLLATALTVTVVGVPLLADHAAATDRVVTVANGETLSEIALREGVSVEQLAQLNGLSDPDRIFAGQRLRVTSSRADEPSTAPVAPTTTHRVAYGETLTGIATRYGTSVPALAAANGLTDPSFIRAGQSLAIPSAATAPQAGAVAPAPASVTHRVAYGETLSGIAARYGTSVAAIAAANGLTGASFIREGQALTAPGAAGTGDVSTPPALPRGSMPASMAAAVQRREGIGRLIADEAARQGVPAAFAQAVAWQESGWQPGVVSSAGAIGVMQLLPETGEWVGAGMLGEPVNLWDPASNVRAGVRLLKHYLDRYGGSRELVLAAYYQGQAAADRHGVYAVSRPYIASILQLERLFGE